MRRICNAARHLMRRSRLEAAVSYRFLPTLPAALRCLNCLEATHGCSHTLGTPGNVLPRQNVPLSLRYSVLIDRPIFIGPFPRFPPQFRELQVITFCVAKLRGVTSDQFEPDRSPFDNIFEVK